jgi:hypothetical protein
LEHLAALIFVFFLLQSKVAPPLFVLGVLPVVVLQSFEFEVVAVAVSPLDL